MNDEQQQLEAFIKSFGAVKHSGRQLVDHLLGTYALLSALKGLRQGVALAGGLHSIYGTNVFRGMDNIPVQRNQVVKHFGAQAEHLAFLFSRINRPYCFQTGVAFNRITGAFIKFTPEILEDLQLIEAANLIEQGEKLTSYPALITTYRTYGGIYA